MSSPSKNIKICGDDHITPHLQGGRIDTSRANWSDRTKIFYKWGNLVRINDLGDAHAKEVVRRAMAIWEAAGAGVKFIEDAGKSNAFEIAWLDFSQDADGAGNSAGIAHGGARVLHFDIRNWWLDGTNIGGDDAESTALHELGHVLGLGHSEDSDAIMYPFLLRGFKKRRLGGDDVDVLFRLYPGWRNLGKDGGKGFIGTPAVISSAENRTDIFVRGENREVYYKWRTTKEEPFQPHGSFESLGGSVTSNITAVSWATDRIDLFARGAAGDVVHKSRQASGSSWSDWESLGGKIVGGVCAVSWGQNRLDVLVTGIDKAVHHKSFQGAMVEGKLQGSWSPSQTGWENLNGTVVGVPAAVSLLPHRIDLFVRGHDGKALYFKAHANGIWQKEWTRLGSPKSDDGRIVAINADVSVIATTEGRIDIFALGDDLNTYMKSLADFTWTPGITEWTQIPGRIWSRPVAMPYSIGAVALAAYAQNANVVVNEWNTNEWTGWKETIVKLYEKKSFGTLTVPPPSLSPLENFISVGVSVAVLKDDQSLYFLR